MNSVKQKLTVAFNCCKFLGADLENFKFSSIKVVKILPKILFLIHIGILLDLTVKSFGSLVDNSDTQQTFTELIAKVQLNFTASVCLIFIYKQRKIEENYWNLMDQLDDLIVNFLGINMNYQQESWLLLLRIIIITILNLPNVIMLRMLKFSTSQYFNNNYNRSFYFVFVRQTITCKFMLYVTVVYNRMKIIAENLHQIHNSDHNLLVLSRLHAILWKLTRKIDKIFGFSMILSVISVYSVIMFLTFLLSNDMAHGNFKILHIFSLLVPMTTIGLICYHCERFMWIVSLFPRCENLGLNPRILKISLNFYA